MSNETFFWKLLSRKIAGEATEQELKELEEILIGNPYWQMLYNEMHKKTATGDIQETEAHQAYAAHAVKMQIQGKFNSPSILPAYNVGKNKSVKRNTFLAIGAAASIIVAALIYGMPYFEMKKQQPGSFNEIITKKGSKSNIRLPDGTQVWLNGGTKLSYSNDFIKNTREVDLVGEAFFDVSHDPAHPFIIHTNKINIKVLGTAFNVRSYPQDETVETSLVRGKIEVILKSRPDEKIILRPNEKLVVNNKSTKLEGKLRPLLQEGLATVTIKSVTPLAADSSILETAWMNDELAFFNKTLEQIALDLERRFNVLVIFEDEQVKQYRYSAFFETEGVEEILSILSLSKKFNYNTEGKTIMIKK